MTERTISRIAKEISQFKGKCNLDVTAISSTLLSLDEKLAKRSTHKQLKRDQPKEV